MTSPSPEEIDLVRERVERGTGLRFDDSRLPLLREALEARMISTRASSVSAYAERAATADEARELARLLTVPETFFLRNEAHFHAFAALVQAHWAAPRRGDVRKMRVLSAGCATGEEAYSIAIAAHEAVPSHEAARAIMVHAVDLNPDVLERARAGVYGRWSLRTTPDAIVERYFTEHDGRFTVSRAVRNAVTFTQHNLLDAATPLFGAPFDVIFCRNVLMYLAPWAARAVVAHLANALRPGGHLFLGHAETLRGLSSKPTRWEGGPAGRSAASEEHELTVCRTHDTFYYRRAGSPPLAAIGPAWAPGSTKAVAAEVHAGDAWPDLIRSAAGRIEALASESMHAEPAPSTAGASSPSPSAPCAFTAAVELMRRERFQDAIDALDLAEPPSEHPALPALRAMLLVATGALAEAEATARRRLAEDDLDASAHYVIALCREHHQDLERATEHGQAAAYLEPAFAMSHLLLARLARRGGDFATARRALEMAVSRLAHERPERIVMFGGGFTREGLVALARAELRALTGGNR